VVFERFLDRAGLPAHVSPRDVVNAVHMIPYGRPRLRTPAGVLVEWRGTCSTKHALLAQLLAERWPQLRPRLVHRIYRAERGDIQRRHGAWVAAVVPPGGLMDVHRYVVIELGGREVVLDVTFPQDAPWDGASSMPVACGPGDDVAAGADPDADKGALEARWCDPVVREPFIAALGRGAVDATGPATSE
jgi:hypothetical protein